MHTHRSHWIRSGVAFLLAIIMPACVRAAPTSVIVPSPTVVKPAIQPPTQTALPPTVVPFTPTSATATPEPTAEPLIISEVAFQNVKFTVSTNIASAVDTKIAPAVDIVGELYPAHAEFTLLDYDSQNTDFEPRIHIYPVGELGISGTQTVTELRQLLTQQPTVVLTGIGIPILPPQHAGQLIDVQLEYLTFSSGSGVRVLTQFAQNSWPINNEGLVYVFQGLTSDGMHSVSAFLPVATSLLPDQANDPETVPPIDGIPFPHFSSPNFNQEYSNYHEAITKKLNTAPPDEFVPPLSALDNMIKSISIASESSNVPCLNAPPTRLQVGLFAYVNPDPPLPNNVRSDAGKDFTFIGDIQPGKAMKILDGPKCADGWVWWKVRTIENELVGWTAEGDQQNYWLIPCSAQRECGP